MTSILSGHDSAPPRWCRPLRQRAAAAGLSAAALILVAACSSGGESVGSTPLPPRQALLAAAAEAHQVTSAIETLTVRARGASNSTTTGTLQVRLKPTLLVSGNLTATAAGTSTRIKMIFTSTAIYFNEASLASQVGKPWVEIALSDLSALGGSAEAGLAQLFHGLQRNDFTSQAQLFTVAKNTGVIGTQTIDGVSTTEYTGSFTAAEGLKALPVSLRQALTPALQALGNSTIYFREWIDSQHHLRKMTEIETLNGDTITTTINITVINQPVTITPPPASQTFTLQGSGPVRRQPGDGGLSAKVFPAPPGFVLSQAAGALNGPLSAVDFNRYMGAGNLAASLHFVRGYDITYDNNSSGDSIEVTLFQFATPADASIFKAGWVPGEPVNSKTDPVIPGASDYDSKSPNQGTYDHGVIATKGNFAFVIDDATGSAAPVPLVEAMARQQYTAL